MPPDKYYFVVRYVRINNTCYVYQEIYVTITESEEDVINAYVALGVDTRLILVQEVIDMHYDVHVEFFGDEPEIMGLPHNFTHTVSARPRRSADWVMTTVAIKSIRLFRQQQ